MSVPAPPARPSPALLLVGHGASSGTDASAPVYAHAAHIRGLRRFDDVQVAFWKEAPHVQRALGDVVADDLRIVPMFLADGYFVRDILPRALGLAEARVAQPARRITYCRPIAVHPRLPSLVLRRARECAPLSPAERLQATLVIIGHGTERNPHSGAVVRRMAALLRGLGRYADVRGGFLDEAPRIADVVADIRSRHVVLVPFLLSEGWHTRVTAPELLGLSGAVTRKGTQTLWYSAAIGTLPEVADIAVELALESSHDQPHAKLGSGAGSKLRDDDVPAVSPGVRVG